MSRNVLVVVVFLSCIFFVTSDTIYLDKVVNIDQTVVLTCPGPNDRGLYTSWLLKNGQISTLLSNGFIKTPNIKKKFILIDDPARSTPSLQISKFKKNDTGIYQCQVHLLDNTIITLVIYNVSIATPPQFLENANNTLVVAKKGVNVKLYCSAQGTPDPEYSWLDNNNNPIQHMLGSKENELTIPYDTLKDSGEHEYSCVASNKNGMVRRSYNVVIEKAPIVDVLRPRVGVTSGYGAELIYVVSGFPPPAVKCLKAGVPITDDAHFSISRIVETNTFFYIKIKITKPEEQHFGTYECHATNEFGTSVSSAEFLPNVDCMNDDPSLPCYPPVSHIPWYYWFFIIVGGLLVVLGVVLGVVFCRKRNYCTSSQIA